MARKYSELRARMPEAARIEARRRADATIARMALDELREARQMTQSRMAELLNTQQGNISKLEKRADLYLSTLRGYIEALGGSLEIRATFPEGTVTIARLGDDDAHV